MAALPSAAEIGQRGRDRSPKLLLVRPACRPCPSSRSLQHERIFDRTGNRPAAPSPS